jgi:hypothetical protein
MTTKLEGQLKCELAIHGDAYTITLTPTGFVLALKGRRKGLEIAWADLVSGDAALAQALNASLVAPTVPGNAKVDASRARRPGKRSTRTSGRSTK